MKVLFFVHSLAAGGAERVTATFANHWSRSGLSVVVVTATGSDKDFYELVPAIRRITLDSEVESPNTAAALMNNWRRIRRLRKLLRNEKPDAAIAMMTTANCQLALAGVGLGVRLIGSERVHPPTYPLGSIWEFVRRRSYPHLDVVVAQTRRTAEWLKHNAPRTRVAVIPNPISVPLPYREPHVDPESLSDRTRSASMLLAVGRLNPQKGFDNLLKAFAKTGPSRKDWLLVILGEGPSRSSLEETAVSLDIADDVFFPGAVGNIGDWYRASDLFVLSSRYEGFPNCLLEAMAHDLPVVAVDCDTGPAEIVRHDIDGVLVPSCDVDALAEALDELMSDPDRRSAFGRKAGEVRRRFALELVSDRWRRLLSAESVESVE